MDRPQSVAAPYTRLFPHLPSYLPERQKGAWYQPWRDPLANPEIPAAHAFFAQFVAHDLSYDPTTTGERLRDAWTVPNARTPLLDLDSVYGAGPLHAPYLYQRSDPEDGVEPEGLRGPVAPFLSLRSEGGFLDLPRVSPSGRAVIPDPRNDASVPLSQMHVAFHRFHNRVVRRLARREKDGQRLFEEARRQTTWHYQWVVLRDLLPRLCGSYERRIAPLLAGTKGYARSTPMVDAWREAALPMEFYAGVFRACHSMVRPRYRLSPKGPDLPLFPKSEEPSLRGFRALKRRDAVDWRAFFPGSKQRGPLVRCDSGMSRLFLPSFDDSLAELHQDPERPDHNLSLQGMDDQRAAGVGVPSGQDIACALGFGRGLDGGNDPLWLFVLREAHRTQHGRRFGPVGATIAAEVLVGLLRADPAGFVRAQPHWTPTLGGVATQFGLRELLSFATRSKVIFPQESSRKGSGAQRTDTKPAAKKSKKRKRTPGGGGTPEAAERE